jgi:glycosyltransferase involved in cell wall biosynthesis
MRVVHVITRLSLGGSSENTVLSVAGLGAAGHECLLVAGTAGSEDSVVAAARRRGCRVTLIRSLVRDLSPVADCRAVADLVRLFRRERPDLVHTHTSKAGFVGRLAARLAGVPRVVHTPHGHVFYAYWADARTLLFIGLERLAARWTDRLVALTEGGIAEHRARGIGRAEQWVAIPSGVDIAGLQARAPQRTPARTRVGLAADAAVVVAVGRLIRVKGFDLLVAALPVIVAAVPAARLVLVGEGPEKPALDGQARDLGVAARVQFAGATADVAPWLAAADVLAAPSRNEGMGRVLVEGMTLGVPIVGARVGGIPSVLADGEFGILVPSDDAPALASALVDLLLDPGRRAKLAAAGRRRAREFTVEAMVDRLRGLYDDLARERPAGR